MKRTSFLSLTAVALAALPLGTRPVAGTARRALTAGRLRSVVRYGRADRSLLVGATGACASRRSRNPLAGYTLADLV